MTNYPEMYLKMLRATEKAIRILVEAQQECEEMYLNGTDAELYVLPKREQSEENPKNLEKNQKCP